MLSEGISQQEGKGLARQNYSSVGVGRVSPTPQGAVRGQDPILPVPAPQGARRNARSASGKFKSALTDGGGVGGAIS